MYNFGEPPSQYLHKVNEESFEKIALDLFRYQYQHNSLYQQYVDAIGRQPGQIQALEDVPFLPITFFKTHEIRSVDGLQPKLVFESSGTTAEVRSRHFVYREQLYRETLLRGFRKFYGNPSQYAFLALLPSYLEQGNSSLVHMAQILMSESGVEGNGFFLGHTKELKNTLQQLEAKQQPYILLGVTYALLDFATACPMPLHLATVMETGGMKGRKKEITRAAVHELLMRQWQLDSVHTEYGMTELLSQAYSRAEGRLKPADTLRVLVRPLNDPLTTERTGSGCLNMIDLANVDSCAFIATEDLGTVYPDRSFEVSGRMDHTALRGCSLLTA